jgi:hypothetical protein
MSFSGEEIGVSFDRSGDASVFGYDLALGKAGRVDQTDRGKIARLSGRVLADTINQCCVAFKR